MLKKLSMGLLCLSLSACSYVPAGHQGIIVNLYGSDKGINMESVGVGRYWVGWGKELYIFPTFLQNYTWTSDHSPDESITMQTSEGLTVNSDVGITYNIRPENVTKVFQKYRLGVDEITNTFLRNMVRDAMNSVASTMTVEQLYGPGKESFITQVNNIVKAQATEDGIEIDKIYLIGTFRLPQNVTDSINSKIQATQNAMQVENEVATTKAEAQKTIIVAQAEAQRLLINSQAQAQANATLAKSITPEYLQYQALQKWNGILPQVTGSATPFVSIPNVK